MTRHGNAGCGGSFGGTLISNQAECKRGALAAYIGHFPPHTYRDIVKDQAAGRRLLMPFSSRLRNDRQEVQSKYSQRKTLHGFRPDIGHPRPPASITIPHRCPPNVQHNKSGALPDDFMQVITQSSGIPLNFNHQRNHNSIGLAPCVMRRCSPIAVSAQPTQMLARTGHLEIEVT